jgi:hypothetical protein
VLDGYEEAYAIWPYCYIDAVVGDVIGAFVLTTEWQQEWVLTNHCRIYYTRLHLRPSVTF